MTSYITSSYGVLYNSYDHPSLEINMWKVALLSVAFCQMLTVVQGLLRKASGQLHRDTYGEHKFLEKMLSELQCLVARAISLNNTIYS